MVPISYVYWLHLHQYSFIRSNYVLCIHWYYWIHYAVSWISVLYYSVLYYGIRLYYIIELDISAKVLSFWMQASNIICVTTLRGININIIELDVHRELGSLMIQALQCVHDCLTLSYHFGFVHNKCIQCKTSVQALETAHYVNFLLYIIQYAVSFST